ncbi:Hypothetical_protein [Hexamita inflata]|uniref:Hypothetical_protein n=1 Tax=Hexamita inflata TaxID=28002 RepID=A0AA86QM04_9EUKA|nr:Hypothetical protein HINF_LOCUS48388 [Hexamita inflata]
MSCYHDDYQSPKLWGPTLFIWKHRKSLELFDQALTQLYLRYASHIIQSQELMKFGDSDSCNQKQILVVVLQMEDSLTRRSERVVNDKNLYWLFCDELRFTQCDSVLIMNKDMTIFSKIIDIEGNENNYVSKD